MVMEPVPRRHPEWLVAPLVTLGAVILLLIVARFYDRLPVHPPECGFRKAFGIPCLGCGGTRSMMALARGRIADSLSFSPAVLIGMAASVIWAAAGIARFLRCLPRPSAIEQNRRILRGWAVAGVILLGNWIYLLFYLPP